jgi:hypothetical protein
MRMNPTYHEGHEGNTKENMDQSAHPFVSFVRSFVSFVDAV